MFTLLRQPAGVLAEAVRGFAAVSMLDEPWPPNGPRINRFPAMVYCGVTMITDGQVALLDGAGAAPSWTVFGPRTRPVASLTLAPLRCITAILYPDAFRLLTGCEPAQLKDRNEPGDAWLPPAWSEWPAALRERAQAPQAQMDWMEQWLLRRWMALRPRWDAALGALVRSPSAALDTIGVGQRQLQRQAQMALGLTPIKLQRLQRAQLVLARLADGEALARLAADLGFADQSHLTRDISALTGLPPARLATAVAHDPDYWAYRFRHHDVAFLQDAG